jgi:DNA-binding transcriptional MerR regulator
VTRRYSLGAVCRLLEIKPHVLRYWEQEIDILSPEKDHGGRRVYSQSDVQLLFRIRHLVQERGYTVQAAGIKLLEEAEGEGANTKARIHEVRGELLHLLNRLRDSTPPSIPADTDHDEQINED